MQVGQLVLEEEFFLVGVGEDPASVLVALFVLGEVEVLLLPHLLDLVQFFLVLELLHCLVDYLQHLLLVSLQLQREDLIQSHSFDRGLPLATS